MDRRWQQQRKTEKPCKYIFIIYQNGIVKFWVACTMVLGWKFEKEICVMDDVEFLWQEHYFCMACTIEDRKDEEFLGLLDKR